MKRMIAVLVGLLFLAGTGLALADATPVPPKALLKSHHKSNKKGKKGAVLKQKNTKHAEYKDGEDGVNRKKPMLNPQPLPPGAKAPGKGTGFQTNKPALNPQPLPPGIKPPPGQGPNGPGANIK